MSKGDMNPVMYSILKMVGYKVQIITFSQIIYDFYTYLPGQLCKMPKSFKTDVVYTVLLKTTSLRTFVANKSHRSIESVFLHFLIVFPQ